MSRSSRPPRPSSPAVARRRAWSAPVAILTVLGATAYLFWPLVAGLFSGPVPWFEWDVPEQYWPDLVYLCESLHGGELPYWNPFDRGGYPYYADPQAGLYHPLNWAICGVAGPSPAVGWATSRTVASFALAGLFGLLWLRRLGASWSGATVGAALIEAGPFMRHNWELNLTSALAWLPLMLWAAERAATERRLHDGVVLAAATALCGWVGSPPALWLAGSLTGLYLVFRVGEQARRHGRRAVRDAALPLTVAGALSAGLLGAVIVPGLQLAEHSVQAGRGFDSIAAGALHGEDLWALVWPRDGNHLYVGWIALALIPLALRHERSRLAWFFVAVGALAVLLTTGGPVFRFAFDHVPGVALFRLPHRYEAWLGPAAGAVVALGLSDAAGRRLGGPVATRLRIAAGAAAALGAILLFVLEPTPGAFLLALAIVLVSRTLPRPFDCGSALWALPLVLLVLLDVTAAMPPERHMRHDPPPVDPALDARLLRLAPHTADRWRMMDEFALSWRAGTRLRRRELRGYQDPLLLRSFERVVGSLREHPALAPQFNVRYALQGPHYIHGWDRHFLPPPEALRARLRTRVRYRGEGERSVTELLDALPFAYFVPEDAVERVADRSAALDRVRALAPAPIAVLEVREGSDAPTGPREPPERVVAAEDVSLEPDRLRFSIDAPAPGWVVVNEAHYPGWEARVDERPTAIRRANAFVRAVEVPAGRHAVAMVFRPTDGRTWRQILFFAVLATLVALGATPLFERLQRRA
ncbi:MAG TPA: hypothetical protein RMH99_32780 [Sandaracinaceae bacterium LLY-WYZ-13_1]|nr:hypothetical protein [Sandaracinaceae bacterium LLY-WYZ-13_1]